MAEPDGEKVPGSGQAGQSASLPQAWARWGQKGSGGRAGGLLIQANNDETAPLSCGAKVAVTGGGVT